MYSRTSIIIWGNGGESLHKQIIIMNNVIFYMYMCVHCNVISYQGLH